MTDISNPVDTAEADTSATVANVENVVDAAVDPLEVEAKRAAVKAEDEAKAAANTAKAESEVLAAKIANTKHVVLDSFYSFFDEAGNYFRWAEGEVVTEVEHIKTLLERKAPITVVAK